eukprot:PhM_4_TR5277/c0_g1_i1/m.98989
MNPTSLEGNQLRDDAYHSSETMGSRSSAQNGNDTQNSREVAVEMSTIENAAALTPSPAMSPPSHFSQSISISISGVSSIGHQAVPLVLARNPEIDGDDEIVDGDGGGGGANAHLYSIDESSSYNINNNSTIEERTCEMFHHHALQNAPRRVSGDVLTHIFMFVSVVDVWAVSVVCRRWRRCSERLPQWETKIRQGLQSPRVPEALRLRWSSTLLFLSRASTNTMSSSVSSSMPSSPIQQNNNSRLASRSEFVQFLKARHEGNILVTRDETRQRRRRTCRRCVVCILMLILCALAFGVGYALFDTSRGGDSNNLINTPIGQSSGDGVVHD